MFRGRSVLGSYDVLALVAGIWFLAKGVRYAFPPLFDQLKLTFSVSNTEVGAAFTGFLLVYAVMQLPSGLLADRFDAVRVIAGGAVTTALGAGVVTLGGPFALLVAAMVVMGAGTGAHKTVAITLLARTYPARTGRTLGIFDSFGTFGGVVAPVAVAGVLAVGVGWRSIFGSAALSGLALGTAMALRVPQATDSTGHTTPGVRAYTKPFADRRFVAFVAVTLGFSFAYNGVVAFLPLYLDAAVDVGPTAASLLYSVLFVVSVVQVATGELADRVGRLSVVAVTLTLATVSLGLLVTAVAVDTAVAGVPILGAFGVVGFGLGSHGFRPVRGLYLEALLPDSLAGGGIGAVRSALMGAGAVAPAAVGFVADRTGFAVAFLMLFATLGTATLVAVGLLVSE
ncbi:Sugar phosphate permease [Halovenus aranensis]|uniref:Sugar phosphate permease n=1 Tax=Halovenus aranensis TaxID=890420 RepID=A0A1G8W433_9EURY|nr:MFS transporter [Halovenus aranensis]SDJ73042.1 Sugar phosphate permease [Halovenus aranensis]